MLSSLEQFLIAAVEPALPNAVDVNPGPWAQNPSDGVYVHARTLALEPLGDDPPEDSPAHLLAIHEWSADGSTIDFEIPVEISGELLDVEAPPGHPAARGDQFFLDDRTLRFYRAPAPGDPGVRARFDVGPARGYRRRRPCKIELELSAVDQGFDDADAWLETSLQAGLTSLLELPILSSSAHPNVLMRALELRNSIASIERGRIEDSARVYVVARIELRGELELLVASGSPEPVGIIEDIVYTATVARIDETLAGAEPPAPPPPLASGPRPIDSGSPTLLSGLGNAAQNQLAALAPPVTTLAALAALDVDAQLAELSSPTTTRAQVQAAKLVLASFAEGLPSVAPIVDAESLDALAARTLSDLAAFTSQPLDVANSLREGLLTLQILMKAASMSALTLVDFRPLP